MNAMPTARIAREICNLSRLQLREMGLTSGKVLELYDQARDGSLAEGCTCGVSRIAPIRKPDGTFRIDVFHAPGCAVHPLLERRKWIKRNRRRERLRRVLPWLPPFKG